MFAFETRADHDPILQLRAVWSRSAMFIIPLAIIQFLPLGLYICPKWKTDKFVLEIYHAKDWWVWGFNINMTQDLSRSVFAFENGLLPT